MYTTRLMMAQEIMLKRVNLQDIAESMGVENHFAESMGVENCRVRHTLLSVELPF